MADNVAITAGTGTTVAADEVVDGTLGTVKVQFMKLMDGTLDSTNKLLVNSAGAASVNTSGNAVVSTANSSSTNLSGSAAFTGTSEDVTEYADISVSVFSSHVSATDGLSIQQSHNGTNWDFTDTYTVSATTPIQISVGRKAKFFRLVYTNGATLTTSLRIQTIFNKEHGKSSSQRPQDARTNEIDTEEVSAFAMLYNGTTWDRVRGDTTNGVDVDVTRLPALVAGSAVIGKVSMDTTSVGTSNGVAIAQIGANTVLTGNGTTGTGSQRVTIASDNTPFPVKVDQTTPGTTNAVALAQIGSTTVVTGGVNGTLGVGGTTAAGSSIGGNPVRAGGTAMTANPTAVTDGQVSNVKTDAAGRLVTVQNQVRDLVGVQTTTVTASTSETTFCTASGSGVFNDLLSLQITNSSATATLCTIKDATAGTTRLILSIGANGGAVLTFPTPLPQATANNNWTITCGTSVSSIYVNATFAKNK